MLCHLWLLAADNLWMAALSKAVDYQTACERNKAETAVFYAGKFLRQPPINPEFADDHHPGLTTSFNTELIETAGYVWTSKPVNFSGLSVLEAYHPNRSFQS